MSAKGLLLLLMGFSLAVGLLGAWATARIRLRHKYRLHRDKFFAIAEEIIKAEDCPLPLAIILRDLGANMNSLMVVALLVCSVATRGRLPRFKVEPEVLHSVIDDAPREIREKMRTAYVQAVLAVSYRTLMFGSMIRRHYCKDHNHSGVDEAVIGKVLRYGERHNRPHYLKTASGLSSVNF
jgi:hypothetical protein